MSRPISLAHLTAVEHAPPQLIRLAADAGYDAVGLRLIRVTDTSPGYPLWLDPAMLAETEAAMTETGVSVGDIEFVKLTPDYDVPSLRPFFETGQRLGAKFAIAAPYDPELSRLSDTLGAMAELSAEHGMRTLLEFFPWTEVPSLAVALSVLEQAGEAPGLLFDTLHFDRSGGTLAELDALPRGRLGMIHLCDAEVRESYTTEQLLFTAREGRLPPGAGEIDLAAILARLPQDVPVGLEVPMAALEKAEGLDAPARRAREGARALGL